MNTTAATPTWDELKSRIPEKIVDPAPMDIPARDVKRGDSLGDVTVWVVKVGTARVTVLDRDDRRIGYFYKDEMIQVMRPVETVQSKEARKHADTCVAIVIRYQMAIKQFERTTKALNEMLASGGMESFAMRDVARTQAEMAVYREVLEAVNDSRDEVAAAKWVATRYQRNLVWGVGESRSTSQMHNVIEDIRREAMADLVRLYLLDV